MQYHPGSRAAMYGAAFTKEIIKYTYDPEGRLIKKTAKSDRPDC